MIRVLKVVVDNEVKEVSMSVEEMLLKYDNMFNQFAYQCVEKVSGYQNNVEEFDDFKQIAVIKAIEKFETYDISRGANFSTLLFNSLRGLIVDIIRKNDSKKRKIKQSLVFIDATIEGGNTSIGEIISDTKEINFFEDNIEELKKFLSQNLTQEEIMFYTIDLKKQINKVSTKQRNCLEYAIEIFTYLAGGSIPDKKEDLAILLNISRPTLNKRIKKTVTKVKELVVKHYLENLGSTRIIIEA